MIAPATALVVAAGVLVQQWSPEHPGFDYACRTGTDVYALADGVISNRRSHTLGNIVELRGEHADYLYAHLHTVAEPGPVEMGDVIGTCGNTGAWSYGSHVHLEVDRRKR